MTQPGFGTGTAPQTAPSYGTDLSCVSDMDPGAVEVSGLTLLGQACARRLMTPRGRLLDDPNYGTDITRYVNDDLSPADLAKIGSGVDAELVKDERVSASSTTVTFPSTGILTLAIQVTPSTGPTFKLVIAVSQVTATLLQVST
jgi:phage baseplate assembly protein W